MTSLVNVALPKKAVCDERRQANTGNAGALARIACAACSIPKSLMLQLFRPSRSERARAPAFPVRTGSFHIGSTSWAKPGPIQLKQKS